MEPFQIADPLHPIASGGFVPARMPPTARPLNRPVLIEYKQMRFLISDAPSDSNLILYMAEFQRCKVKHVVRVCDPTYATAPLEQLGMKVHDWPFGDGEGPPHTIIRQWLKLVHQQFGKDQEAEPESTIVVHCVAGLGRAPLLVAIALIDAGMTPEDSIAYVREHKRGALNSRQTKFIMDYKPKRSFGSKRLKCPTCAIL
ncbi:MAG: protein-tyrosine phosphatase-like protein [Benniella sp.]|nr:MAG: protein-tyrosine phosphatase-like protein [Benniella sp.]